jgi:crotonobetainyl-CoA:carnitine CoA-transferase CaiB-like acyl-CoA transferase
MPPDHVTPPAPTGPLAGIRVLDLSTVIMAPYATQLLGDLGAEVVKVESGSGDGSRVMGGGPHPELSGIALNLHRNKRSISLDLKADGGREVFLRLLDGSDVFVTNLRPGPLRRLGLSYDDVAAGRPGLVYCQAQGFRSDGDEADRPAYDDIIQAVTGMPSLHADTLGTTDFLPSIIGDKVAGMTIALGVLAALVHRAATGAGQRVEVPMFDAVLAFNLVEHLARAATPGQPTGYSRIMTANRGPHRTTDGYIAMIPYTDRQWRSLFTAVGREDLLEEPWFADHRTRLRDADRTYGELAAIVAQRSTAAWLDLCREHEIPASPVPTLDEIVDDAAHHRGVLTEALHPVVGVYRQIGPPLVLSDTPVSVRRPAPLVAEHTEEVLAEAGYGPGEVDELVRSKVVRVRDEPSDVA